MALTSVACDTLESSLQTLSLGAAQQVRENLALDQMATCLDSFSIFPLIL